MSKPETIKIDDVEYIRADKTIPDPEIKIVVLDRGFVYVGATKIEGDYVIITKAHNISVWGTTKGLGELTAGPTASTKLDRVGTVKSPLRALISIIDVDNKKWNLH